MEAQFGLALAVFLAPSYLHLVQVFVHVNGKRMSEIVVLILHCTDIAIATAPGTRERTRKKMKRRKPLEMHSQIKRSITGALILCSDIFVDFYRILSVPGVLSSARQNATLAARAADIRAKWI